MQTQSDVYAETIRRLATELLAANREIAKLRAVIAMRNGSDNVKTACAVHLTAGLGVVR